MDTPKKVSELEQYNNTELIAFLPEEIVKELKLHPRSSGKEVKKILAEHLKLEDDSKEIKEVSKPVVKENVLRDFASGAKTEASKPTEARDMTFVAKNSNYRMKSKGLSKKGILMRYAVGHDTLDIKSQNADNPEGVEVDLIHFASSGNRESEFKLEGFGIVRSEIKVPAHNPRLQEYILNHQHYGMFFIEFDKKLTDRKDVEKRKRKGKLEGLIASASRNDLICPLVYIDSVNGVDSFNSHSSNDLFELQKLAYDSIDYDFEKFMDAVDSNYARILHLVNLSLKEKVIKLTGREVLWTSSNKNFVTIPMDKDWNSAVVDHLLSPENMSVIPRLEELTGYNAVV